LRAAQGREIELGGGQKRARIDAPAMRGVEDGRPAPFGGLEDLEGGIEFGFRAAHGRSLSRFLWPVLGPGYISMWAGPCQDRSYGSPHIYRQCGLWGGLALRELPAPP